MIEQGECCELWSYNGCLYSLFYKNFLIMQWGITLHPIEWKTIRSLDSAKSWYECDD